MCVSFGKVFFVSFCMSENILFFFVDFFVELCQCQSELVQLLFRYCFCDGIYGIVVEFFVLICVDGFILLVCGMYKFVLCIIVQGCKEVQLVEECYIYDLLYYLVVLVILLLVGQVIDVLLDVFYFCVWLDIDLVEIIQLIFDVGFMEVVSWCGDCGFYVDCIDVSLLDVVLCLIYLLDSLCDILMLVLLIFCEIFYCLLCSGQGQCLYEIVIVDSQVYCIICVIDWINQNYGKLLCIE